MIQTVKHAAKALAAVAIPASLMIAGAGVAAASPATAWHGSQLTVRQVLFGMKLHHTYIPAGGSADGSRCQDAVLQDLCLEPAEAMDFFHYSTKCRKSCFLANP